MLHARSLAYRSGNEAEYNAAKYRLKKTTTAAKKQYRERLDGFYTTDNSLWMWQGLQHIKDYRTITSTISPNDSLPDDLNTFYTRFETLSYNTERQVMFSPPSSTFPLARAFFPLCFKTTTIVPLPKKSPPTCMNDYRPLALSPIVMNCFKSSVPSSVLRAAYRTPWTQCSVPTDPTGPPQMPSLLPSTIPSTNVESILTSCITVWYGSTTAMDCKYLQRVMKTANKITRTPLPSPQSIYHPRVDAGVVAVVSSVQ